MKVCTVHECERKHAAHGLCRMHWQRMLRNGTTELKYPTTGELTQLTLKQLLDYDPTTGIFRWKVKIKGCVSPGDIAGFIDEQGYRIIRIFKKNRKAHRLAWLYTHGEYPELLDHTDRNRSNNALSNLRLATPRQNTVNRSSMSRYASGYTGVYRKSNTKKWEASVTIQGQRIYLGVFDEPFDAAKAREIYCKNNLGEFYKSDLVRRCA